MIHFSTEQARTAAQANARYFKVPYVVFTDTSFNVRVERYDANMTCHNNVGAERFYPPKEGL